MLAEIPEGPPARFTWRHVTRRVIKAEGPERIAPEWWRSLVRRDRSANFITSLLAGEVERSSIGREGGELQAQSLSLTPLPPQGGKGVSGTSSARPRDYYRIEDEDGRRYWVFREGLYQESEDGAPGWFLHGVFG